VNPRAEEKTPPAPNRTNGVAVDSLQIALFRPAQQTLALLVTKRGSQAIRVYSPVGFTTSPAPPVLWKSQPGKTYEIAITDELTPTAPPLRHSGATYPLDFRAVWPGRTLAEDGLYRLSIFESGNPINATELVFRTVPSRAGGTSTSADGPGSTGAPEQLLLAYQILTTTPSHLGDALAQLLILPPDLANSEMALRLKLFAFGQLGYQEDFEAVLSQLQR
jgi:hypothetical protein